MCGNSAYSSLSDLGVWYQCANRMNIDTVLNRQCAVIFANALRRRFKWRHRLNVDECWGKHIGFPARWCINRKCVAPLLDLNEQRSNWKRKCGIVHCFLQPAFHCAMRMRSANEIFFWGKIQKWESWNETRSIGWRINWVQALSSDTQDSTNVPVRLLSQTVSY